MKFKHLLIALIIFVLGSCSEEDLITETPTQPENSEVRFTYGNKYPENIEKGTLIIKFRSDIADKIAQNISRSSNGQPVTAYAPINKAFSNIKATSMKRVYYEYPRFKAREREAGMHQWYTVQFDDSLSVYQAMQSFDLSEYIEVVEPSIIIRRADQNVHQQVIIPYMNHVAAADSPYNENDGGATVFNDPLTYRQWHYHNTGSILASMPHSDINLLGAWDITTGHPDVIVCVVDGGVAYDHPDLAANMWINEIEDSPYKSCPHGWNFVYDINEIDKDSHGTHVAGTIAAVNNNGIGVCGVAGGDGTPNSGVRIMTAQVFPNNFWEDTATDENFCNAIKFGADHGAVISQNSWGLLPESDIPIHIKIGIDYFIKNAGTDENGNQIGPMKGGIFIAAAGNEGYPKAAPPATHPEVVSVTSITPRFTKSSFSNYKEYVCITAPGGVSSKENDITIITELGGGDVYSHIYSTSYDILEEKPIYEYMSGTSMATPHVSGVAALIVSQKVKEGKTDGFTPEYLKKILYDNARDITVFHDEYYKNGIGNLVDATKALTGKITYSTLPVDKVDLSATWMKDWVSLDWDITGDKNGIAALEYCFAIDTKDIKGIDFNKLASSEMKLERVKVSGVVGDKMSRVFTDLEPNKQYWIAISGLGLSGIFSEPVIINGMTTSEASTPPTITIPIPNISIGKAGDSKTIDMSQHFTSGDGIINLTFTIDITSGSDVISVSDVKDGMFTVKALKNGSATILITAANTGGQSTSTSVSVVVGEEVNITAQAILYPNPVVKDLTIDLSSSQAVQFSLVNTMGAIVLKQTLNVNTPKGNRFIGIVDLSKASGGAYTALVKMANGEEYTQRITKR